MYAHPKVSNAIPLLAVLSHSRKFGDEDVMQVVRWRFLSDIFLTLSLFRVRGHEFCGELSHVEYPSNDWSPLGSLSGSAGVRPSIPLRLELVSGNPDNDFARSTAACHRERLLDRTASAAGPAYRFSKVSGSIIQGQLYSQLGHRWIYSIITHQQPSASTNTFFPALNCRVFVFAVGHIPVRDALLRQVTC